MAAPLVISSTAGLAYTTEKKTRPNFSAKVLSNDVYLSTEKPSTTTFSARNEGPGTSRNEAPGAAKSTKRISTDNVVHIGITEHCKSCHDCSEFSVVPWESCTKYRPKS